MELFLIEIIELFVALSWTSRKGLDMVEADYGVYLLFKMEGKFDEESEEYVRNMEVTDLVHE